MSLQVTSRRQFMALAGVGALFASGTAARADGATDAATAFMTKAIKDLSGVVNGSGNVGDKAVALQAVIDKIVDVSSVGRFCLGRFWRTASADEQKQYMDLFHKVLLKNITGKVGDYSGVDISIQRTSTREDGVVVTTTVARPNAAPAKVDWLVSQESGQPLIVDVIAEGTSLRLTQRNDYGAFLSRNNNSVTALIDALKQQANS